LNRTGRNTTVRECVNIMIESSNEDDQWCDDCEEHVSFIPQSEYSDEETFSTPCGSMTSDEIREHIEECGVCEAEHADIPLDL
jgi:hypothetical protein